MKGIVIYKSRYGAARQYAEWIAEELNIETLDLDKVKAPDLQAYDYIVAGSSIYIGKILIKDWLAKNENALRGKKLFLYVVGGAPVTDTEKTYKYFTDNVSKKMQAQSQYFYMQGKTIYQELSPWDKFLLKAGAMLAGDPKVKQEMLTDLNALDRKNVQELVKAVRKYASTASLASG